MKQDKKTYKKGLTYDDMIKKRGHLWEISNFVSDGMELSDTADISNMASLTLDERLDLCHNRLEAELMKHMDEETLYKIHTEISQYTGNLQNIYITMGMKFAFNTFLELMQ